jgi:hypothetical protein
VICSTAGRLLLREHAEGEAADLRRDFEREGWSNALIVKSTLAKRHRASSRNSSETLWPCTYTTFMRCCGSQWRKSVSLLPATSPPLGRC